MRSPVLKFRRLINHGWTCAFDSQYCWTNLKDSWHEGYWTDLNHVWGNQVTGRSNVLKIISLKFGPLWHNTTPTLTFDCLQKHQLMLCSMPAIHSNGNINIQTSDMVKNWVSGMMWFQLNEYIYCARRSVFGLGVFREHIIRVTLSFWKHFTTVQVRLKLLKMKRNFKKSSSQ